MSDTEVMQEQQDSFTDFVNQLVISTFDNSPPTRDEDDAGIKDWAECVTTASVSLRSLQESLATKDKIKTRQALENLADAVNSLDEYLRSRGV